MSSIAVVSGGFDPVHVGHVRMFQDASEQGTVLIVIINNDNWLRKKKGYVFMPQKERQEIIEAFDCVFNTVITDHSPDDPDTSVCDTLRKIKNTYHKHRIIFCNGGDRVEGNLPSSEEKLCEELGIEMRYGMGGGKIQSSSNLVEEFKCKMIESR